ncbi:MAG: hypothetical protein AAFP82_22125, partial [Bacteroidota bacterium]
LIGFSSNAQQQIKILNAFQHYKIQASTDYSNLLFLVHENNKHTTFETTYLNKWEDAFLVVSENEIYSIKARYNIFEDAFYTKLHGKEKIIYPHLIQGVVFKDRIFVSRKEMLDSGLKDGYYELLSDGTKELLRKYAYNYKLDRSGNVKLGSREENIYIKDHQGLVKKIDLTPKVFFDTFEEHQMAIKKYADSNALSLRNVDDLVTLFNYYNRMLAGE